MSVAKLPLEVRRITRKLGREIQIARLRRRLPAAMVADRAGIARMTLYKVERGDPGVSLGAYASVLWSLGLSDRIARLIEDDSVGLHLEEERLPKRIRLRRTPERP